MKTTDLRCTHMKTEKYLISQNKRETNTEDKIKAGQLGLEQPNRVYIRKNKQLKIIAHNISLKFMEWLRANDLNTSYFCHNVN